MENRANCYKQQLEESENAACATAYWFANKMCPGIFPAEKVELAAETAIRYYAKYKTKENALSYINTFRLYESQFWQTLGETK